MQEERENRFTWSNVDIKPQENCYRSTVSWIKQQLREGKKVTFDELRQRYLHDFLQWYVKAIRGEPQYVVSLSLQTLFFFIYYYNSNVLPNNLSPENMQQYLQAKRAAEERSASPEAKKEVLWKCYLWLWDDPYLGVFGRLRRLQSIAYRSSTKDFERMAI